MAKAKSGGGITGKNVIRQGVRTRQGIRTGQPARAMSPKGVSQIGSSMGNHSMEGGGKILRKAVEPTRGGASQRSPWERSGPQRWEGRTRRWPRGSCLWIATGRFGAGVPGSGAKLRRLTSHSAEGD
jgi:hypothetical protein